MSTNKGISVVRLINGQKVSSKKETIVILPGESYRFVVSRSSPDEDAVVVVSENGLDTKLFDLLDRAHFPTQEMFTLESGSSDQIFNGNMADEPLSSVAGNT